MPNLRLCEDKDSPEAGENVIRSDCGFHNQSHRPKRKAFMDVEPMANVPVAMMSALS